MKTLRRHQDYTVTELSSAIRGIVNLPTGTGKTLIQSRSISTNIVKSSEPKVYVILSPRIVLSNQLLAEVKGDLLHNRIDCQYLVVNSSNDTPEKDKWLCDLENEVDIKTRTIKSTVSSTVIKEDYDRALREQVPLVISSTYHSAQRIVDAGIPVETVYCDEAHYLVRDDFHWIATDFQSVKMFFFTATMRETPSADGMGMNNEDRFGGVISQQLPIEMINSGDIIRPRMHIINIPESINGDNADGAAICSAYIEHDTATKISGKLLVVTKGSQHIEDIVNSSDMKRFLRTHPNLTLFDISSEHGARVNGQVIKRKEWLRRLQGLQDNDQAIILHIDILTEGIDVPGITGIMPMNGQGRAKFLQTLGRATRLHPTDRTNLWGGEIQPNELNEMVKPYAWIVIPAYGDFGQDLKDNIKLMVDELRTFGFNPVEDIVVKEKRGKQTPVEIESCNEMDKKVKEIVDFTSDILHTIEEEEEAAKLSQAVMEYSSKSYEDKKALGFSF